MRDSRAVLFLTAAVFLALFMESSAPVSAQFFRRERRPMRKASELIRRQAPPTVSPAYADAVTPDNASVLISLSKQRAYLMAGGEVYIDTPVSTGKNAGMTPTGSFTVLEKDPDHRSSIYGDFVDRQGRVVRAGISLKVDSAPSGTRYAGAPMKYFMRLTYSGVGMHIGILPGYPASHGCIRLPSAIAPLIYRKVKIGTEVTIEP
jgi:lipoprotein-anchoring transpeptidase ErfK/SrfK